jgi:hypothetical protein
MNAPAHTAITRRLRAAPALSPAINGLSSIASGHVKPPGTSSVSIGPSTSSIELSTPIRTPELETTSSPSSDAMRTR